MIQAARELLGMLTSEQQERLNQIAFQLRGVETLYREDVASRLQLDLQQRATIMEIRLWARKEGGRLHQQLLDETQDRQRYNEARARVLASAKRRAYWHRVSFGVVSDGDVGSERS